MRLPVSDRVKVTRWFAIATAIGMLIVLLMGARVTATGSGDGCGNDWPLCHGRFLPENTYESITEYSHRIVTGGEGLLVVATALLAWPMRHRYPESKLLVPLMAGTLVLQSLMGAAAVKWPTSPEVMATHFGISLICLASAALLARVLNERRESGPQLEAFLARVDSAPQRVMRPQYLMAVAGVVASLLVAYSGAYVRHRHAELACVSWPTCNGKLIPEFTGLAGVQTIHRLGALLIILVVGGLVVTAARVRRYRPELFRNAVWCMVLVLIQALLGKVVIDTGLQLLATLAHAAGMSILFVLLCDAVRMSLPSYAARIRQARSGVTTAGATGSRVRMA